MRARVKLCSLHHGFKQHKDDKSLHLWQLKTLWRVFDDLHSNSRLEKLKLVKIPAQTEIFIFIKPRMSWICSLYHGLKIPISRVSLLYLQLGTVWCPSGVFHKNNGLEKVKFAEIPILIDIFVWIKPSMPWIFYKWGTSSYVRALLAFCGILLTHWSDFGRKKFSYLFKIKKVSQYYPLYTLF